MKDKIHSIIISAIPDNSFFDTHSIIEYLKLHYRNIYEQNFQSGWTTAFYHSEISKTIASFEGTLLKRQGESWSKNINKEFNLNKGWIKL